MTQPLTETVAAEVRAHLARRNISRSIAAEHIGISRTLLWNRLRGESPFTVTELEKLAELLEVPVTQFLPAPARAA
jgi:transcriptional regulator with XRE-family HTH domain